MLGMFDIRISGVRAARACRAAVVGLAAAACLTGCSRSDIGEEPPRTGPFVEEPSVGEAYIRFRMNLIGGGIPAGTRAAGTESIVPDSLPGSSREDAINTLDLLVYDAETDLLFSSVSLGRTQIASIANSGTVTTPVSVVKGKKVHIYAVANLPEEKRRQLLIPSLSDSRIHFFSTQNDYWKTIDEFVPGCDGKQELLEETNGSIPMTGQFKTADGRKDKDIEFTDAHTSESSALSVSADLTRMVAKIHVLAKTRTFPLSSGEEVDYVCAEDKKNPETLADPQENFSNWLGWIRLENVRYMPNGTNKSTYLFPQPTDRSEYPLWQDCNMDLESYVVGGVIDAPMWTRDYCFYSVLELHRENASAAHRLAGAEAYDEEKLRVGAKESYTRGMYCLENYFDTPSAPEIFESYDDVIPMVTHVYIAAKLTPRDLVIVEDYQARMDAFVDRFRNSPDEFREQYGLIETDFTQEDVKRWETFREVYKDYFTGEQAKYRDGAFRIIKTKSEKDAAAIINWSLMCNKLWSGDDNDFENGKYPAATFYVYDTKYDIEQSAEFEWTQSYLYLTAGAVASATDANVRLKTYSVPHVGGWGYYYTYLDQTRATKDGPTPYTASQVTRNTYYLLTVGNFGVPGGTITRPEYIKVNTVPVGWDYHGRGDVDLH